MLHVLNRNDQTCGQRNRVNISVCRPLTEMCEGYYLDIDYCSLFILLLYPQIIITFRNVFLQKMNIVIIFHVHMYKFKMYVSAVKEEFKDCARLDTSVLLAVIILPLTEFSLMPQLTIIHVSGARCVLDRVLQV